MDTHKSFRGVIAFAMSLIVTTAVISAPTFGITPSVKAAETAKAKSISQMESEIGPKMDISSPSGISKSDFIYALEHCKYDTNNVLGSNAEVIWDECQEHSLNEWVFTGLIAGESGWCTSSLSVNKHNIMSIKRGGSYCYFDSYSDCIEYTASLLDEAYISKGGRYYTGSRLIDIGYTYAGTDYASSWADLVCDCAVMCMESAK